jgi:dolichol-phosphate mannosyltransferase
LNADHKPETANGPAGAFVLLPVLNEIANIAALLDRIQTELAGMPFTIGVLDDGSTDGTIEYVQQRRQGAPHRIHLICRKKTHRASQRGGALRTLMLWGLANTTHEVFIEMDGDLSHRPEELQTGLGLIRDGWDVAIASKYVEGSAVINRPWGRRMVSRVCSIAVGALLSRSIRDYSNGFRFYTRAAAQLAASHHYRYGSPIYLSEILALWMRHGQRIKEFESIYVGRAEGISKLRIADLVKAAIAVFEISFRYHVAGFKPCKTGAAEQAPVSEPRAGR